MKPIEVDATFLRNQLTLLESLANDPAIEAADRVKILDQAIALRNLLGSAIKDKMIDPKKVVVDWTADSPEGSLRSYVVRCAKAAGDPDNPLAVADVTVTSNDEDTGHTVTFRSKDDEHLAWLTIETALPTAVLMNDVKDVYGIFVQVL